MVYTHTCKHFFLHLLLHASLSIWLWINHELVINCACGHLSFKAFPFLVNDLWCDPSRSCTSFGSTILLGLEWFCCHWKQSNRVVHPFGRLSIVEHAWLVVLMNVSIWESLNSYTYKHLLVDFLYLCIFWLVCFVVTFMLEFKLLLDFFSIY